MPRVSSPCLFVGCNKKVVNGIACDICDRWAHKTCTGISENVYSLLKDVKALEWFCPDCKRRAKDALPLGGLSLVQSSTPSYKASYASSAAKASTVGKLTPAVPSGKPFKSTTRPSKPPKVPQGGRSTPGAGRKKSGRGKPRHTPGKSGGKSGSRPGPAPGRNGSALEHLVRDLIDRVDALKGLQNKYEHNLGRTKNLLIYAPEPEIRKTASRHAAEITSALLAFRRSPVGPKSIGLANGQQTSPSLDLSCWVLNQ